MSLKTRSGSVLKRANTETFKLGTGERGAQWATASARTSMVMSMYLMQSNNLCKPTVLLWPMLQTHHPIGPSEMRNSSGAIRN